MRFSPIVAAKLAIDRRHGSRLIGRLEIEHLLALAGVAETFVLRHDEAVAGAARHQEFAAALIGQRRDHIGVLLEIDKQAHRLAMPAPAREL